MLAEDPLIKEETAVISDTHYGGVPMLIQMCLIKEGRRVDSRAAASLAHPHLSKSPQMRERIDQLI